MIYICIAVVVLILWFILGKLFPYSATYHIITELSIKIVGYGLLFGPIIYYLIYV